MQKTLTNVFKIKIAKAEDCLDLANISTLMLVLYLMVQLDS